MTSQQATLAEIDALVAFDAPALEWVRALPAAAREVAAREARILAVARGPDCTADKLIGVFRDLDAIH